MKFNAAGLRLVALLFAASAAAANDLPSFQQVRQDWRSSEAWLLDRDGRELQRLRLDHSVRRYAWVAHDQVSPALKDALLASEDQRFFEHEGVDWKAALNAATGNLGAGNVRGASTLPRQLAGMLDPELKRDGAPRTLPPPRLPVAAFNAAFQSTPSCSKKR